MGHYKPLLINHGSWVIITTEPPKRPNSLKEQQDFGFDLAKLETQVAGVETLTARPRHSRLIGRMVNEWKRMKAVNNDPWWLLAVNWLIKSGYNGWQWWIIMVNNDHYWFVHVYGGTYQPPNSYYLWGNRQSWGYTSFGQTHLLFSTVYSYIMLYLQYFTMVEYKHIYIHIEGITNEWGLFIHIHRFIDV